MARRWPDTEGYDIGPPGIARLTRHVGCWWSMVLGSAFGAAAASREHVVWPASADDVRERLGRLQGD